jgi:hypothetical protein
MCFLLGFRKIYYPNYQQTPSSSWDNASFHKRADFQHLIEQQGHLLEFLPPYSPDLNPIEHKWAQAKALRRQKNVLLTSCLLSSFRSFYTAFAIAVELVTAISNASIKIVNSPERLSRHNSRKARLKRFMQNTHKIGIVDVIMHCLIILVF